MSVKYIFGASANKIQKYVFNSNKFKEIVGASKIVEQLSCAFGLIRKDGEEKNEYQAEIIQNATGSFKAVFPSAEKLNAFITDFNKSLSMYAPNLQISQVILKKDDFEINNNFSAILQEMESKLSIKRNFPDVMDYSPIIAGIYPATGFASLESVKIAEKEIKNREDSDFSADFETMVKLDRFAENSFKYLFRDINVESIFRESSDLKDLDLNKIFFESEFDKIKNKKNLIAVVHSDGNGTGFLIKEIFGNNGKSKENFNNKDDYKSFSENLNAAVKESACYAILKTFKEYLKVDTEKYTKKDTIKLPFRIFTLSGEDFNFVCHPDYVFELLRNYILKYEELTSKYLKKFLEKARINTMTTTAGISFSKSHFPFYMSFDLAESLCGRAKKITKHYLEGKEQYKVPSTILFHFVQSSYFNNLDHIIKKERLSHNEKVDFLFGPYTIKGGHSYDFTYPDLGLLIETANVIKKEKGLRGAFRQALSIINIEGEELVESFLERVRYVNKEQTELILSNIKTLEKTSYYDKSKSEEESKNNGKIIKKNPIYDIIYIESSIDVKWDNNIE